VCSLEPANYPYPDGHRQPVLEAGEGLIIHYQKVNVLENVTQVFRFGRIRGKDRGHARPINTTPSRVSRHVIP
jgi:hypothetical protein